MNVTKLSNKNNFLGPFLRKNMCCALCSTLFAFGIMPPYLSLAADFAGSLNKVTISDPSGTNIPPTAVINYSQNGDTFAFDAGGSSDSDGNINEFRWDFGDGSTGTGATITHQFTLGSYPVTLTVIDNTGNVSLSQILVENTLQNIIPNADNIQAEGWLQKKVTASSANTWTEDGTASWAWLETPTFALEVGANYTLSFEYISSEVDLSVSYTGFTTWRGTCNQSAVRVSCSDTITAKDASGSLSFNLERGVISSHTASIFNLLLTKN